jgi:hypothetical protein
MTGVNTTYGINIGDLSQLEFAVVRDRESLAIGL